MNIAIKEYLAVVVGFLLSSAIMASPVTIPNIFISGTPARAEDVNANFNSVKAAVNDNDAKIKQLTSRMEVLEAQRVDQLMANPRPVFLKSNGQNIGIVIGKSINYTALTEHYDALSFKEYFFIVSIQSGSLLGLHTIYYSGTNCTGQAYIPVDQLQSSPSPRGIYTKSQGEVFGAKFANDPIQAYYVAQGTESVTVTPVSAADFDTCSGGNFQHQFQQIDAYPAFPNAPEITGVENSYATPIRGGY